MPDTLSTVAFPQPPRQMSEAPMPGISPGLKTARIDEIEEITFVLDFIEKSQRYRESFIPIWDEIRDNYMVVPFGQSPLNTIEALLGLNRTGTALRTIDTKARLKDPETHQVIETLVSQALLLLLGPQDYIRATPIGADDYEKARMVARLLMAFMDQPGQYRTHYQLFKHAFLYGTAYCEVGWQTLMRNQPVRRPYVDLQTGTVVVDPDTGRPMQTINYEGVIYRDAPLVKEIPIRQFYPDPSGTRINEDMHGCAKGFRIGRMEAQRMRDGGPWNDKDAVTRALARIGQASQEPPSHQRGETDFAGLSLLTSDKFGMYSGFEYWGEVPFNRPGGRNRVIAIWAGERVRSHPIPFIDGEIPIFEVVVNPIGGRHYGVSPAEVIRFLQDSTDNFLMIFSDAGDLAIRGPLLMGNAFGGNAERVKASLLNDVIACRNVDALKPIPRDMSALSWGAQEMSRRILRMREAAGATNPLQAIPGPVEKTATETSELVRLASQRVQTMVELIERDCYPRLGRLLHSRFRQFMGNDVDTLAILRGETWQVTLDDIDIDADVRFVGSQFAESPAQIIAKYKDVIGTIGGVPPGMVEQYPEVFLRLFRDGMKIPDAETIVGRAISVAQMQAALTQAQNTLGQGQQPGQSPGGLPASSPDMGAANEAANSGEGVNGE